MMEMTTTEKLQIIRRWSTEFRIEPTPTVGGVGTNWWCHVGCCKNNGNSECTPIYKTKGEAINRCLELLNGMVWEKVRCL